MQSVYIRLQLSGMYMIFLSVTIECICVIVCMFNPCPAELFQLYFSSFEAGIANAISSFKWRKI